MFLILLWSLLRGEQAPGGMGVPPGADALSILKGLVGQFRDWVFRFRADWTLPVLAAGFFCFLAPSAAQTSALLWHLVRRGSDDFGRDYYTFAVGGRARRAAWSGALLLPFAAVLLWVTPPFAAGKAGILPFGNLAPEIMTLLYNMLPLGLPLAVLCCYLPGRSASPLRRKSLIFWHHSCFLPACLPYWSGSGDSSHTGRLQDTGLAQPAYPQPGGFPARCLLRCSDVDSALLRVTSGSLPKESSAWRKPEYPGRELWQYIVG